MVFPRPPKLTPDEGPSLETSNFALSFQVVREPLPFTYLPWHSGMSLHPYELVALPPRVQKCLAKNGGKMLHLVAKTLFFILMQNYVPIPGNYCTIVSMQKLEPFLHSVQKSSLYLTTTQKHLTSTISFCLCSYIRCSCCFYTPSAFFTLRPIRTLVCMH